MNIVEEKLLRSVSEKLDRLAEDVNALKVKHERQSPFIDDLMQAEEDRQKLYLEIRSKIIGTGAIAALSTMGAIIWYAAVHWLKNLM